VWFSTQRRECFKGARCLSCKPGSIFFVFYKIIYYSRNQKHRAKGSLKQGEGVKATEKLKQKTIQQ
jgi:hypothetical protein